MEENNFWLAIWKMIGIVFVLFVATIAGCVSYHSKLIANSQDPLATSCAISDSNANAACIVSAKH